MPGVDPVREASAAPVKRDWSEAREKVDREGACRVCRHDPARSKLRQRLEAAHVAGREFDGSFVDTIPHADDGPDAGVRVRGVDVVPLCQRHHAAYDARELDLLPYLTFAEQAAAVVHLGIVGAVRRISAARLENRPTGPSAAAADRR